MADLGVEEGSRAQLGVALALVHTQAASDGRVLLAISSQGQFGHSAFPEGAVHFVFVSHSADEPNGEVSILESHRGSQFGANATTAKFGRSLADVGDWNEDDAEINDVLVGAPGHGSGCIFLISPSEAFSTSSAKLCGSEATLGAMEDGASFGSSLAWVRNRTVLVGATGAPGGGAMWILKLTRDLAVATAMKLDVSPFNLQDGDRFGAAVAVVHPDFDRSSKTLDIAVGAPHLDADYDDNAVEAGAVFIITINEDSGEIIQHYKIQNFNVLPLHNPPITSFCFFDASCLL